jgi:hypothetical protein
MSLNGKYNGICHIHIKYSVLHAKSHVSLPSYFGSTFQRITPVIPHGLTPATQKHYMVIFLCFTEYKRGADYHRVVHGMTGRTSSLVPMTQGKRVTFTQPKFGFLSIFRSQKLGISDEYREGVEDIHQEMRGFNGDGLYAVVTPTDALPVTMVTLNIPIAERTSAAQRPRRRFAQPVSF